VHWPKEKIGWLSNLQNEEAQKQAIDPIRCAYFDAIEVADHLLKLVDASAHCEELS
jgi:hypothetical protein